MATRKPYRRGVMVLLHYPILVIDFCAVVGARPPQTAVIGLAADLKLMFTDENGSLDVLFKRAYSRGDTGLSGCSNVGTVV